MSSESAAFCVCLLALSGREMRLNMLITRITSCDTNYGGLFEQTHCFSVKTMCKTTGGSARPESIAAGKRAVCYCCSLTTFVFSQQRKLIQGKLLCFVGGGPLPLRFPYSWHKSGIKCTCSSQFLYLKSG